MDSESDEFSTRESSRRDILENQIYRVDPETLHLLLQDHSTGRNIRWATKDYLKYGLKGFGEWDSITIPRIIRKNGFVIQPRIDKSAAEQRSRSVGKAEVFTPSWVCNKQNNLVDAAWFGRENAGFNEELETGKFRWKTSSKPIRFPSAKSWRDYVNAQRLEVACGEAPYLTSRYDTVTGFYIEPADRIGLLDRKLRVVSENVPDEGAWLDGALLALQSVYGYEYQGDNVLIARENLLYAVKEYFSFRFGRETEIEFDRRCAEIISWNIWQMDGIKYVVPGTCHASKPQQLDLFVQVEADRPCPGCRDNDPLRHNGIRCRIMAWEAKTPVLFVPPFDFEPIPKESKR